MGPVAGTSSVREQGTLVFSKTTEQWRQTLGTWTGRQGTFAVGRICGSHTSGSPHHKAQTNRRRFLSHCVLTRHMGTSCALLCRCTAYSAHSRLSVLMQRPDSPSQTQQVGRRSSAQNSRSETTDQVGGMAAGKKKKSLESVRGTATATCTRYFGVPKNPSHFGGRPGRRDVHVQRAWSTAADPRAAPLGAPLGAPNAPAVPLLPLQRVHSRPWLGAPELQISACLAPPPYFPGPPFAGPSCQKLPGLELQRPAFSRARPGGLRAVTNPSR